jgi:alpha-amylase
MNEMLLFARRVVLFIILILSLGFASQGSHGGVILQLSHDPDSSAQFPWNWGFIKQHVNQIQAAGYTALLISPHQKSCGISKGYNPEDFTSFDSSHGSEQQLADLITVVHGSGMQIYADMVMNHMCRDKNFTYRRFGPNDFHHQGNISNWQDEHQVENGSLFGLEDLAQESPYVRQELFAYLVKTNNMGFDGYRWDAAKHVPRWFWKDHIVNNVNAWGKFNFGEIVESDLDRLQLYVNTGMAVADQNLYTAMADNFKLGGNLAALDGAGYAGRNGVKALTFVENHDYGPPANRLLAYAFISAYPGYPLFYNVLLNDKALNNLIWVHENLAKGPYINRYKDQNTLVFERRGHLLAGINQSDAWVRRWVQTSWRNTRLHDYSFHVEDKWANNDGYVEISIPPMSYVMLAPG